MRVYFLFLLVSLTLYGLMHVYAYRKIVRGVNPAALARRLLRLSLPLLALLPFLGRVFDHDGNALLARLIDWPAYVWMAWVFWFCMGGVTLDLYNAVIRLLGRFSSAVPRAALSPRRTLSVLASLIAAATAWGLVEAGRPQTRFALIYLPDAGYPPEPNCSPGALSPGLEDTPAATPSPTGCTPPSTAFAQAAMSSTRLVHVSDIHLSPLRSARWNNGIVERIRELHPDVVVSTGDLVDSSMLNIGSRAAAWATLAPPLGKYAVLGNHEYYAGIGTSLDFHGKAGFRLLRSESVTVAPGLVLFGVDDFSGHHMDLACFDSETALAGLDSPDRLTVLLKHQPRIDPQSLGHFDLQLSGHTHGGQIFPFQGLVRLLYAYTSGMSRVNGRSSILVNRGLGTWGPPLRLFAPPEIVVIDFACRR